MIAIYIAVVIAVIGALWYVFPVMWVSGTSMYPTLRDGDIGLGCRIFLTPKEGKIYAYRPPVVTKGKIVIKRLTRVTGYNHYCYFEGDNPPASYDSRNYGTVDRKSVIAVYLFTLKRGKEDE